MTTIATYPRFGLDTATVSPVGQADGTLLTKRSGPGLGSWAVTGAVPLTQAIRGA